MTHAYAHQLADLESKAARHGSGFFDNLNRCDWFTNWESDLTVEDAAHYLAMTDADFQDYCYSRFERSAYAQR